MMQLGTLPGLPIRPGMLATPQIYSSLFIAHFCHSHAYAPEGFCAQATFLSGIQVLPLVILDGCYRESRLSCCHFDPREKSWPAGIGNACAAETLAKISRFTRNDKPEKPNSDGSPITHAEDDGRG